MTRPHSTQDKTGLGIALMMGFVVFGPFIDLFAKLATAHLPVFQIAVGRFIVQGALLLPYIALRSGLSLPPRRDCLLYLLRGGLILASTGFIVGAIKFMPLADAIAIVFVEPLILLLLGWFFLGESIGPRRLLACIFGFAGALLVIQPSFEEFGLVAILPLCCAMCFALYLLLTRSMSQRIDPVLLRFGRTCRAAGCSSSPALPPQSAISSSPMPSATPRSRSLALSAI